MRALVLCSLLCTLLLCFSVFSMEDQAQCPPVSARRKKAPPASCQALERQALLFPSSGSCPEDPERTPCEDLQTMQGQARVPLLGGARGAPTDLVSPSKAQFLRHPRVPSGAGTEAQALGASAPSHWSP
ncbi:PREDICTED: uncharacterized protein LOC102252796 [Myotis brandtii]|uniref:uncharacterized protein LOC102252796 n=1 Tax=Myotis brandtii TaxID=109478 RepID=UPI0007044EF3|nr:PREDICTED: uncharacterized protein LOC102252796 [Myotis brandtii]